MYKKIISGLLILSICIQITGCYSYHTITRDELVNAQEYKDLQVVTKNKYIYEFDEENYTVNNDSIYGSGRYFDSKVEKAKYKDFTGSIYTQDIEKLKFDEFDVPITILSVTVVVGLIALIVSNIKPSLSGFGGSGNGNEILK